MVTKSVISLLLWPKLSAEQVLLTISDISVGRLMGDGRLMWGLGCCYGDSSVILAKLLFGITLRKALTSSWLFLLWLLWRKLVPPCQPGLFHYSLDTCSVLCLLWCHYCCLCVILTVMYSSTPKLLNMSISLPISMGIEWSNKNK